mgnify:CR=1 FL=1
MRTHVTARHLARALFTVVAAATAWFGATYLLRAFAGGAWAAAYHERLAGGVPFDTLSPEVASLYLTLVGALGSLFLATSVATLLLARAAAVPGGSPAAWTGLAALNGLGLVLLVATNLRNGLNSPWWMNCLVLALLGIGLALVRPARVA